MKMKPSKMAKITAAFLYFSYSLSSKVSAEVPFISESSFNKYLFQVQQKGNVSGRIVNAEGKPLANVRVQLTGTGNTRSDKEGYFKFEGVMYGKYELVISLEGFESTTQSIEVYEEHYQLTEPLVMQIQTESQNLDEVVVTASRLAEHIDEVPSSITYIGGKTLDQQRQINDNLPSILMQKVPSISPSEESQNNFIAKIRGRNFLVLIDGIPQSTPLRNGGRDLRTIDASAIDHIEVINGATAMYGNGAAGGVINYITKKPKKR